MATVNYSWNLPTVGGSEDTWGTSLNANWTDLDTLLGGVSQTEFAILDGATVSTAELNILDGVTATATEINQLDADSTGALKVPTGTVAERPTPAQGQIRFNSDDTTFEGYDGTAWGEIGGADFSAVAEDIIPDADSTRDLGSLTKAWAEAHVDTVISTNVSDGTTSVGTTYVTNGSAKAWVNFDGTGTIAARDSLNVSSLTDNGTGDYDISVSSAFADTNYQIVSCSTKDSGQSLPRFVLYSGGTKTSSAINITVEIDTGQHQDNSDVYVTHFGDLA